MQAADWTELTGTSVEMISRTYGHIDLERVREIQRRMSGGPIDPELREPRPRYGQDLPKQMAI